MGDKSFLVKVKRVPDPGWSGTPVHVFADNHLEAERTAKRLFAQHHGCNIGDVDAKAIREDAKTVWKGGNKR